MAKKRRQKIEKKDEFDLKLPEFDEHQYISLELRKIKVSVIAFIFAIIMVIVTYQLYLVTYPDARAPVILGILGVLAIPIISRYIKIEIDDFDWKNWFGAGAVYVLTWLAVFILVCNPPFSDFIEPEIDDVKFTYQQAGNNTWRSWDTDPGLIRPTLTAPVNINVSAKISDNSAVDKDSVDLIIKGSKNSTTYIKNMEHLEGNFYRVVFENSDQLSSNNNPYTYSIEAKDVHGHKKVITGKFDIK